MKLEHTFSIPPKSIATHTAPTTTHNHPQFLPSVDASTTAIIVAKRLALDARSSGSLRGDKKKLESLRLSMGAQAALIAARMGKDVQVRLASV